MPDRMRPGDRTKKRLKRLKMAAEFNGCRGSVSLKNGH